MFNVYRSTLRGFGDGQRVTLMRLTMGEALSKT